ncbi:DUF461 domain-containing protein [Streptomyces sp. NPDC051018]|uniref:DUF461 domain-containing protein n=1 Tax=Streptomyces sp. NPDC051018 TaxID=3365639 RepID=UPI0037BA0836
MSLPLTPSGGAPRLRRGALAVTAVALSFTALTACGAGNNAQTLGVKPDTAFATVDDISVQNANVITQPKPGAAGPAVVSATIFNAGTKDQTLDSVTLPGGATVKLSAAGGPGAITVPAEGSVVIGGKGNASAVIDNGETLTGNIGGVQDVVFRLSDTGEVKLQAFVVPASRDFVDFGPSSLPTRPASPAASPAASPGGSPGATPAGQAGSEGESPASGSASPDSSSDPSPDSSSAPANG